MSQSTAFWSSAELDPVRKYRFQFSVADSKAKSEVWWWATTVTKPSYEVNSSEYQLNNHKFKYPGILTWQDVNITIVDTGNKAKHLMDNLEKYGYSSPTKKSKGIAKDKTTCVITQFNAKGEKIEEWKLNNVFVKAVSFGDLEYSSDEFVEIQLTLMYDWADFKAGSAKTASS